MPPPMIRVTRARPGAALPARCGAGAVREASAEAAAAREGWFWEASRRITRTSSSTERPLRAARSRNSSRMASSSFRIVRLAIGSRDLSDGNASIRLIALQSQLADGDQYRDESPGDDPERQRAPAALASLGARHLEKSRRGQRRTLACHNL